MATLTELTFLFGAVEGRALDVVSFVDALPRLCGGALVECDLGTSSVSDPFVCVARLRGPIPDESVRRLDFWAWRLGGTISQVSRRGQTALRACDLIHRQVRPELLSGAARGQLVRFLVAEPDRPSGDLPLRLGVGRPDAAGLAFDREKRAVFVPSPRQPPLGEELTLEIRLTSGEVVGTRGVVTEVRGPGHGGPGAPAGFVLELVAPGEALIRALEAGNSPAPELRRAPRYPVRALATVERADGAAETAPPASPAPCTFGEPGDDVPTWIENLSQGGAFVRTVAPAPVGTRIHLDVDLPGWVTTGAPGTVVHSSDRGMGIHFEADAATDAAIGSALAHVTAHRRRALVVDDDLLSRRMMGGALAAQGFEVYYAADGTNGLRALIDLLLDLHLLVVDLHMPGLDGEELIRRVREAGGERELTVVAMSGDSDPIVKQRLAAAGADVVLPKSAGMAAIAEGAVRTMLRRERTVRWHARALDRLG